MRAARLVGMAAFFATMVRTITGTYIPVLVAVALTFWCLRLRDRTLRRFRNGTL